MIKRIDIHRPSAIQPKDYQYIGCLIPARSYYEIPMVLKHKRIVEEHMAKTGGDYSKHEHKGICQICGAYCDYVAVYYHAKSNSYIKCGFQCANKLDMGNAQDFRAIRKAVKDYKEAKAGKQKAKAILDEKGLSEAWKIYNERGWVGWNKDNRQEEIIDNIISKLVRYGNISKAQEDLIKKLLEQIDKRAEIKKQREEEKENAQPCPNGKVEVRGVVISIKMVKNKFSYGEIAKMLVKSEDGYLVFGSVPQSIYNIQKGDKVIFQADVQPSNNDNKFGYFKRPRQAKKLVN
jgi:hypothetical protein